MAPQVEPMEKEHPDHARKENPNNSSARCLSCGGQHKTDECPKKQKSFQSQHEPDQAPFICLADQVLSTDGANQKITTSKLSYRARQPWTAAPRARTVVELETRLSELRSKACPSSIPRRHEHHFDINA